MPDRNGIHADGLPDIGGPQLVQFRYFDHAGELKTIDIEAFWSDGSITLKAPKVQPAQQVEILLAPNKQDFLTPACIFNYVTDPKLIAVTPSMVPLSFAIEVSVELTEKVGFESCARLKFPCGSEENASSHSAITQCMPDEKVPTIVNCKLPLPSVHEDIPRFISFLASYMSRNIPLEIAIDGQNFKPCGNLLSPETDMQFYSLPDVKNISPNGGPPDARAICTLSLYSEYVPIENRRSGRSGSKAREHEIEVKFASMLLEDDIIVPARH